MKFSKYFSELNWIKKPLKGSSGRKNLSNVNQDDVKYIKLIHNSGLFNNDWYSKCNEDLKSIESLLIHFYYNGGYEGRSPNYLFDSKYYLNTNKDVAESGTNPLLHYILHGEEEGRKPSILFDPHYYKNQLNGKDIEGSLLNHFISFGSKHGFSPIEDFDCNFYIDQNPDISEKKNDAYEHFLFQGYTEKRNPSKNFDLEYYSSEYDIPIDTNPFIDYLLYGKKLGRNTLIKEKEETGVYSEINKYTKKSEFYEDLDESEFDEQKKVANIIAFYLPQFYHFKENNEWWGKGFTEWTNTSKGTPRFESHYQPRIPRDLGFYNLKEVDPIKNQIELAKQSGIHGFCFYYYWFNGKRLLDVPLDNFVSIENNDFPFCIMYANENWTRTWDGLNSNVLMKQDYLEKDDDLFVKDICSYISKKNYIRINGKPLFIIYRPGIITDSKKRIAKWKTECQEILGEEVLFYMVQGFGDNNPMKYELDGALEFPPHKLVQQINNVNQKLKIYDPNFEGHYFNYDDLIKASIEDKPVQSEFDLIKTIVPSWDNEARKPGKGMGFIGSTPEKYENWLNQVIQISNSESSQEKPLIFVNAWNEWAEAAYLEPDLHYGSAYLNATKRAVSGSSKTSSKLKLIYVGHDAHKHGAQLLSYNIIKTLTESFGVEVHVILLEGGDLLSDYKKIAKTYISDNNIDNFNAIVKNIKEKNPDLQYSIFNTVVTGLYTEATKALGIKNIQLIHELEKLIIERSLQSSAMTTAKNSEKILFASKYVKDSFEQITGDLKKKAIIKPQGVYQKITPNTKNRNDLRKKLKISQESKIIICLGYGDLRKGIDLFLSTANQLTKLDDSYHFLWLGDIDPELKHWFEIELNESPLSTNFHNLAFTADVSMYLGGADCYALTSREDPYPSVVMEALNAGIPVVGFENGGGYVEILENKKFGQLVRMADTMAMAKAIQFEVENDNPKTRKLRIKESKEKYEWNNYVFSLLEELNPDLKRISVVVPNYNYADHLKERLESIFDQNYPIYEIIILDDNSSDDSINVIETVCNRKQREFTLIKNKKNSGSVFRQWKKAGEIAKGEILWIAEADDSADECFLSHLVSRWNESIIMGFTDSKQIDENGTLLGDSYNFYFNETTKALETSKVFDSEQLISEVLGVKNLILNVSGVIFNTQAFQETMNNIQEELFKFKVAGDWRLYLELAKNDSSKFIYSSESLNIHRRHSKSVTHSNLNEGQLEEIKKLHILVNKSNKTIDLQSNQFSYIKLLEKSLEQSDHDLT